MSLFNETYARAEKAEAELVKAHKEISRLSAELKHALNELDNRRMELVNVKRQLRGQPAVGVPALASPVRMPTYRKLTPDDFALSASDVDQLFKAKKYYDAEEKHG